MTSPQLPFLCPYCTHLNRDSEDVLRLTCKAFPSGIPMEVINNEADHRQPLDGDNGIQFKREAGFKLPALLLDMLSALATPDTEPQADSSSDNRASTAHEQAG